MENLKDFQVGDTTFWALATLVLAGIVIYNLYKFVFYVPSNMRFSFTDSRGNYLFFTVVATVAFLVSMGIYLDKAPRQAFKDDVFYKVPIYVMDKSANKGYYYDEPYRLQGTLFKMQSGSFRYSEGRATYAASRVITSQRAEQLLKQTLRVQIIGSDDKYFIALDLQDNLKTLVIKVNYKWSKLRDLQKLQNTYDYYKHMEYYYQRVGNYHVPWKVKVLVIYPNGRISTKALTPYSKKTNQRLFPPVIIVEGKTYYVEDMAMYEIENPTTVYY